MKPDTENLFFRTVTAETGGLCGLAAMYWALFDTVKSKSQITKMKVEDMRATIFQVQSYKNFLLRKRIDYEIPEILRCSCLYLSIHQLQKIPNNINMTI